VQDNILGSFTSSLSFDERQKLRAVVKQVHLRNYPADMVNDYEADKLIDALGPKVGKELIERAMARGMFS
jgi:hypothetical protein